MKKILIILIIICGAISLNAQQKISQYTRTDSLKGSSVPYKPDSALLDVSVWNFAGSYSTRAITWKALKTLIFAGDTSHLSTLGDTGWGNYRLKGTFINDNGNNHIYNQPILTYPNFCGSVLMDGSQWFVNGVTQKTDDTTSEITYKDGAIINSFSVHREYMSAQYTGSAGAAHANKIRLVSDSIKINMHGILSTVWDTTGKFWCKQPVEMDSTLTVTGKLTINDSIVNQISGSDTLQTYIQSNVTNWNSTNPIKLNNNFGINTSQNYSRLAVVSSSNGSSLTKWQKDSGRVFNFRANNATGLTYALLTAKSSFNLVFTKTGKPILTYRDASGNIILGNDTLNAWKISSSLSYNTSIGTNALSAITTGYGNTAIGYASGKSLITGNKNVMIGDSAGLNYLLTGTVLVGHQAGQSLTGLNNTFIGFNAGKLITSGTNNTLIGYNVAFSATLGDSNVLIGSNANMGARTACVAIGAGAIVTGDNSVAIGYTASAAANKLVIANSNTATPLLGGDFSALNLTTTANMFLRDSSWTRVESSVLDSLGSINLTTATCGSGTITIDSAGYVMIIANVSWDIDGTTYINVVERLKPRNTPLTYGTTLSAGNILTFHKVGTQARITQQYQRSTTKYRCLVDLKRTR